MAGKASLENVPPRSVPGSSYSPTIDGLRAVAVVAVLIFHISPSWLPGGFLGVDIFFVISGYLIGRIVLGEIGRGEFRFRTFLFRRFRRLAPSFILVLVATSVIGFFVYSPTELQKLGENLIAAVLGVSNVFFILQGPYELVEAGSNPLLHTWSLGVEEQFYLVFPAIMWLIFRLNFQARATVFIASAIVVSFSFALLAPGLLNEAVNFFSLPSRAWELGVGVLAAHLAPLGLTKSGRKLNSLLSILGLMGIGFSLWFLGSLSSGPSFLTIIPIVSTVAVILAAESSVVAGVLASRVMRFIGLISYPLYLWHFPLFSYWELLFPIDSYLGKLALAPVTVLLAAATYFWLEKPIRSALPTRAWMAPVSAAVGTTMIFGVVASLSGGFPFRVANMPKVEVTRMADGPADWVTENQGESILLLGDSQMRTLIPELQTLSKANERNFGSFTEVGCQFLIGVEKARKMDGSVDSRCSADKQQERLDWINSHGPSTVILGGRLPLILSGDRFNNQEGGYEGDFADYIREPGVTEFDLDRSNRDIFLAYEMTVTTLIEAGHTVVLVYPIPEAGWHVPDTLARKMVLSGFKWPLDEPLTTSYDVYRDRVASSFQLLDSLGESRILRVYPHELWCDSSVANRCVTHSESEIYYSDEHHPSDAGAAHIARLIWGKIER